MIKSVIQKIIWGLIRLEIRLKGPHIKDTLWRRKLISYPNHVYQTFESHRVVLTADHSKNEGAHIVMKKADGSSPNKGMTIHDKNGWNLPNQTFDPYRLALIVRHSKNKSAYIIMEKAAFTSIKHAMIAENPDRAKEFIIHNKNGWNLIWRMRAIDIHRETLSLDDVRAYWTFTFVRNPFVRLTSFFQNRYIYKDGQYHHKGKFFLFPILEGGHGLSFEAAQRKIAHPPEAVKQSLPIHKQFRSFDHFVRQLVVFPDHYCDQHTVPQHIRIDRFREVGGRIDFIGKFETLNEDFEKIRTHLDLALLTHMNKSTGEHDNWRDCYTPKTAKMVYQRYRKDFERFGYQDEYPKLLDYLATKRKKA